jgi:hypothetical protein
MDGREVLAAHRENPRREFTDWVVSVEDVLALYWQIERGNGWRGALEVVSNQNGYVPAIENGDLRISGNAALGVVSKGGTDGACRRILKMQSIAAAETPVRLS